MAKQRYINTKFWSDSFIVELNPLERYLFIYLLTNEHTNISGVYELPIRTMAFETGLDVEMLPKMIDKFVGRVHYIDGWLCLKNFTKHQSTTSKKVQEGIEICFKEIPSYIVDKLIGYGYPIHRSSRGIIYSNSNSNSNKTNSTENGASHKNIFEFYVLEVKKQYGISPAINGGKDGRMVQSALKKHGEEKVKKIIEYYLQSDKAKKIGYDLSTALSAHSINMYLKDNEALI